MPVMWDLCSGLGGASEAFLHNGWTVIRIENNPDLKYVQDTIIMDLKDFEKEMDSYPRPDLIWASPPCLEFSNAFAAPKMQARMLQEEYNPNMEMFRLCENIIHQMNPDYWVIENVMGAQEYFNDFIGKPNQIITSFCLWGQFPRILMPKGYKHLKHDVGSKNPLRSNYRAIIPYEVSLQLMKSIQEQTKIEDWFLL